MTLTTRQKLMVGAAIVAVGIVAYFGLRAFFADEERPPIIVRGGSLYFENKSAKRPGKPWQKPDQNNPKEWEPNDNGGKKVSYYQVYFTGGGADCVPAEAESVVVNFVDDSGTAKTYRVTTRSDRPIVIGPDAMNVDPNDNTRLIASTGGRVESIVVDSVRCSRPSAAYLEPMK